MVATIFNTVLLIVCVGNTGVVLTSSDGVIIFTPTIIATYIILSMATILLTITISINTFIVCNTVTGSTVLVLYTTTIMFVSVMLVDGIV